MQCSQSGQEELFVLQSFLSVKEIFYEDCRLQKEKGLPSTFIYHL